MSRFAALGQSSEACLELTGRHQFDREARLVRGRIVASG
jgi:hypothetical protein